MQPRSVPLPLESVTISRIERERETHADMIERDDVIDIEIDTGNGVPPQPRSDHHPSRSQGPGASLSPSLSLSLDWEININRH